MKNLNNLINPEIEDFNTYKLPLIIYELIQKIKHHKIIIPPNITQPQLNNTQINKILEPLLINLTTPTIYLYLLKNGTYLIINEIQQVNTIINFLNNNVTLNNLQILPTLNGKKYNEISTPLQTKIESHTLKMELIPNTTPINLIYQALKLTNTKCENKTILTQIINNANQQIL